MPDYGPSVRPSLSIVVVAYNMRRELPRTLVSLSPAYQRGVEEDAYEVVVVDNGSSERLDPEEIRAIAPNIRYHYVSEASPSPAAAVNLGVALAAAEHVGVILDGARMVTPGVVLHALSALRLYERPIVTTLGWHLGPDVQSRSSAKGYDQRSEDTLLQSIAWPTDGYRLFEIAALAPANSGGWFSPLSESPCLFLPRRLFDEMGGYEVRFDLPRGGFLNLDTYARVCDLPRTELIVLMGEGSFHQFHRPLSHNLMLEMTEFRDQYERIRGRPFHKPAKTPTYLGSVPTPALGFVESSARLAPGR
ncbi:MAG TPA: glycosyltransferase family A protein [Acidimicrobiales bacterium]|nr:glycosyltransferase family A protein [Acidimicrobiales bacterium]